MRQSWDLVVVGAGPAGAATAIGALRARPGLSVLLLDRSDFPRDKACGDGIAPHAIELLAAHGVTGLVDDQVPVSRLRLERGGRAVARDMARPAWVVPREVFDVRLVEAATRAGAVLRRHRVREVEETVTGVTVDGIRGRVVVGADGAHSVVAARTGPGRGRRTALAIRGYAPTSPARRAEQVIVFGDTRQPSYAWSFDRGDGWANIGYGELLTSSRTPPSRSLLLDQLEHLLPGAAAGADHWRAHHLPLAPWRWRPADGRVLLTGDAAGLINPMTGEGIYYAVLTGLLAGHSAASAVGGGRAASSGVRYRAATRHALGRHLAHTALANRLTACSPVLDAGLRAADRDQRVFDDLVDIGLADGVLSTRLLGGLVGAAVLPGSALHARG